MDVGGSADPYFVAKLGDDKVTMVFVLCRFFLVLDV